MGPACSGLCASAQIPVVLAGLAWLYVVVTNIVQATAFNGSKALIIVINNRLLSG